MTPFIALALACLTPAHAYTPALWLHAPGATVPVVRGAVPPLVLPRPPERHASVMWGDRVLVAVRDGAGELANG